MIHRWIKQGKAKFKKHNLVQVFKQFNPAKTVPAKFVVGIDPGYKNIGYAVYKIYNNKITELVSGEVVTRTSEIKELLDNRRMFRRLRRRYRRKNVLRKFGKVKFRVPRWKNRKKKPFAPTHNHLIQSHLNLLTQLFKLVNFTEIHLEYSSFDSQKLQNPSIKNWQYQKGLQFGFENVKAYVRARDNYQCQNCGSGDNLRVHHIVERSESGSDRPDNLITVCDSCHNLIHQNRLSSPAISTNVKMRDSGVLNSCLKKLYEILADNMTTVKTFGYITSTLRKIYQLKKSHETDAKLIALSDENGLAVDLENCSCSSSNLNYNFCQFRRHQRSWVKRYVDRKYVETDFNTTVAWNRKRRSAQDEEKQSLQEVKTEYPDIRLIAKPGKVVYRKSHQLTKFRPGDTFRYGDEIDVVKGWSSTMNRVGGLNIGYVSISKTTKICNNSGLVIVPAKAG